MSMQDSVEYGVRIRCAYPECGRTLTNWSFEGTPGRPPMGAHESGVWKSWFLYYRGHDLRELGWRAGHDQKGFRGPICYCPEHAAPAVAWLATWKDWEHERWAIGKETARKLTLSWAERWNGTIPADKIDELAAENRKEAAKATQAWLKEHPAPLPPWAGKCP
jgi:hypothetical protein